MSRNSSENGAQCTQTEGLVRRNRQTLMPWLRSLDDDMASNLVNLGILPVAAEQIGQVLSAYVSGNLHATDNTSSRTSSLW
jgi:hypothetical protein